MPIYHPNALIQFLTALIDQQKAQVLVPPYANASGYWFGGGNLVPDASGKTWLCGRYRNFGDSRTGLASGTRGLECAILCAHNQSQDFTKICSWSKTDLSYGERSVLSIEGTALHQLPDGTWELFISSEKELAYPDEIASFQKPGTGVWTIDRMTGPAPDQLEPATLEPILENFTRVEYLHVKDPVVYDDAHGNTLLIFCSHPFSWTSSNSGLAVRTPDANHFTVQAWEVVGRGPAWDVAATRITSRLTIPQVGVFADAPPCAIYFYDGAECLRPLEENQRAHSRPRGYSCEEIGGAFFGWDSEFPHMARLSALDPLFISPHGTGCSRYVETMVTADGVWAIWEQGQADESQPLVGHFLPMAEVVRLLS